MQDMVTSDDYRHVPTGRLACLAQRLGRVFASPSTWHRLVRIHRWRRPRQRVHPVKPKVGIRAARANEIWHIDTTVIRLLDGSRVYLRAVIDNFSRRILAWNVIGTFDAEFTAKLLLDAVRNMTPPGTPTVMTDGGSEDFNAAVDELERSGVPETSSGPNGRSILEFDDRILVARAEAPMAVPEHARHIDHGAKAGRILRRPAQPASAARRVHGQTPDEMYFGTGADVPKQLQAARLATRQTRLAANRALRCQSCSQSAAINV